MPNLLSSLVSYWKLDEVAGPAKDYHGSNNLAEVNPTISGVSGKIGNGRDFEANLTQYFSISDNTGVSVADIDFTFSTWVKAETLSSFPAVLSKDDAGSNREYIIYYDTTAQRFIFGASSDGSVVVNATANNFGAATTGLWYFIVGWHDSVANTLNIQVNNTTADSTVHSTGVFNGTAPFEIGGRATSLKWDGIIDEVGFWKRILTSEEKTQLYNNGNGITYPFYFGRIITVF